MDEIDAVCVVCSVANARVTVVCAACAKTYHLACHTPALRRRPASEATWECSACSDDDAGDGKRPNGKMAAAKKNQQDEEEEEKEELETTPAKKRRRGSGASVEMPTAPTKRRGNGSASGKVESSPAKPPARGKQKQPASGGKAATRGVRKPVKVQEPELAFKRGSRAAQRGKKAVPVKRIMTDEDEEELSVEDDDGDSDFNASEDEEEEEEEEEEEDDASDDDFEAPMKPPVRKLPTPTKQAKRTPVKKPVGRKRPTKKKTDEEDDDANDEVGNGDQDSRSGSSDEGEEEEEVYTGPSYFVEYAPNARSSCKSCEQKLLRDELRVGVKVRHSMFGITTYFKHVACTQICLYASTTEGNAEAPVAVGKDAVVEKDAAFTKETEPIRGLRSLRSKDRDVVLAHMRKNAELGLLDERRELSEDQYTRKTRVVEKEPSPFLTATLLPYQREALAWMTTQEKSEYRGGILADEMGMGKTLQAISLIIEKPRIDDEPVPESNVTKASKARSQKVGFSKTTVRGGTLVVCPLVAVTQWKSEIERFVEANRLSIYIHHGPKRHDLVEKIAAYDIVLTTYSIIESEARKTLGWEKVPCKYCKKKYLPDKLILHNKYFCGPNAKKTKLQDRQQTKKPKKRAAGEEEDTDSSDEDDLKKPVKGKKSKKPVRKNQKKKKGADSEDEDDDLDDSPQRKQKGKSPMHQIHWTRIVLDEAHYIKDRRCNTARGVFELKSDFKWCLTGTPLQNRIGELFSLVRFLQIKFYAYYHCSKCDCQKLDFDFPGGKCQQCDHIAMHHFSYFNKKIVIPIQSYGYVAEGKVAMLRLQNELLQHILLRRTKEGRADDISLPPKLIRVRRDRLDERENDFYQAIYTQSQAQFNTYVSSGTLLNNYAHIFDLLIRLRQAVDHPYLVIYSKSNPALQMPVHSTGATSAAQFVRPVVEQKPLVSVLDNGAADEADAPLCVVCHEDAEDPVTAACAHVFCRECVKEFIESLPIGAAATCPDCDKPLTVDLSPPKPSSDDEEEAVDPHKPVIHRTIVDLKRYSKHSILHRISDIDSFQTSTKIEALMQELAHMKARDPSGKAIIFSQFVNMLDIIQHRLTIGGVKCVKLSGNMSMDMRDRMIRAFRDDNSVTAFLISLKAGGVALNLTVASHIYLMDPWWNPAAENQAIDRTHRLGQFKPVQATRFIIAGTIEERILKLQEKKQLIFEGTVGASVSAICRLTEDDLRFLFSK